MRFAMLFIPMLLLSACGSSIPNPKIEFPVVSKEFVAPVQTIKPIKPHN